MEKNVVMIDLARYNEMVKAEEKLKMLKAILEHDKCEYGYCKDISMLIDGLVGVKREEKEGNL